MHAVAVRAVLAGLTHKERTLKLRTLGPTPLKSAKTDSSGHDLFFWPITT